MIIKSTKTFHKLPVAHCQFFDTDEKGGYGPCAGLHGYDRSVTFEFSGRIDENGWVIPFGGLKEVRKFLEYYFDHTAVVPANDPRLDDFKAMAEKSMLVLRVLPYGVSMEMSALFIWEHVSRYVYSITGGRCVVTKVECREHDSNSAFIEFDYERSRVYTSNNSYRYADLGELPKKEEWDFVSPHDAIRFYR